MTRNHQPEPFPLIPIIATIAILCGAGAFIGYFVPETTTTGPAIESPLGATSDAKSSDLTAALSEQSEALQELRSEMTSLSSRVDAAQETPAQVQMLPDEDLVALRQDFADLSLRVDECERLLADREPTPAPRAAEEPSEAETHTHVRLICPATWECQYCVPCKRQLKLDSNRFSTLNAHRNGQASQPFRVELIRDDSHPNYPRIQFRGPNGWEEPFVVPSSVRSSLVEWCTQQCIQRWGFDPPPRA